MQWITLSLWGGSVEADAVSGGLGSKSVPSAKCPELTDQTGAGDTARLLAQAVLGEKKVSLLGGVL